MNIGPLSSRGTFYHQTLLSQICAHSYLSIQHKYNSGVPYNRESFVAAVLKNLPTWDPNAIAQIFDGLEVVAVAPAASLSPLPHNAAMNGTPGLTNTAGNNDKMPNAIPSHAGMNYPDAIMPLDDPERALAESSQIPRQADLPGSASADLPVSDVANLHEVGGSQTGMEEMEGSSAFADASPQQPVQQEHQSRSGAVQDETTEPDRCDICHKDMALVVNDCLVICRSCGRECYCLGCEYRLPKHEWDLCRACLLDQEG